MGGFWSGQRASKKVTTEGCLALDTADLKRMKILLPGSGEQHGVLNWSGLGGTTSSVSYSLTVRSEGLTFWLSYRVPGSADLIRLPVRLVSTRCHLGGSRWWFVCPLSVRGVPCDRRVRKVFLRDGYFGCRHCHELTYRSTQESDRRVYAALRSGVDVDRLLDGGHVPISQIAFAAKLSSLRYKRDMRLAKRQRRN